MHTLTTAPPSQALRSFVRAYAQRQTGATDLVVMESCPAQLERVLQFEFGNRFDVWHSSGKHHTCDDINVVCCHTMFAGQVELRAGIDSFAVFFQPTGFSRLFEVPAAHTTNYGGIEGTSVLGSSIRELWNRLGESSCFEDRVHIAETFLLYRSRNALQMTPITWVAEYLFRTHGCRHVPEMARATGLGLRQFERRFLQDLGMSPKVFARVARFQAAVDKKIKQPGLSWLSIAHSFGYHDQMHMIHDFESMGGDAPAKFLTQLGNMRFPTLSDS